MYSTVSTNAKNLIYFFVKLIKNLWSITNLEMY
jgi:hypothetical protein